MADKATIILHSGDMDKVFSALIVANGALAMGMEVAIYFTFWGLQRLRKVMNPLTGLNIVRTNLVRDIEVKDGSVRVTVDLPKDHQFASAIREEITDKIEALWDVKKVAVVFTE